MNLRRGIRITAAFIACLLTFGGALGRAADEPYVINVILPLTGPYAFGGQGAVQGLQAVERVVNASGAIRGRPLKFDIVDDQSNAELSVQLTNAILAKNVPVLLGSESAAGCRAMLPLVKSGPVTYCMSPASYPEPGSYGFSASFANADLLAVGIRYFRLRGLMRVATITSSDASGQDADQAIDAALAAPENKDMKLVAREHFGLADISADAQLSRIKATQPQALIIGTTGTPAGTVFRGLTAVGLDVPTGINNGNASYAEMTQFASILPRQLYFFGAPMLAPGETTDSKVKAAVDSYFSTLKSMGVRADVIQTVAWDPALIVVNALRKLGPSATASQLRAEIATLSGWIGVNGQYDFKKYPQRGLGPGAIIVARWAADKGTWVGVSKPGGEPLR